MVLHVAYDVVMQEGHEALGGARLWRQDVEVDRGAVAWLGAEVDKLHLDLDPVRPDHLKAGRNGALSIAIWQACRLDRGSGGLDRGSGGQDECQGGDGYCADADTGRILEMGHPPTSLCGLI